MTKVSEAAYDYLAAGLTIIALTGKQPHTLFHRRGLLDALQGKPDSQGDRDLVERVFTHELTTGVGIVIQPPYFVVDIDGEEGAATYADILGTMDLDINTPVAKTGRGLHIWYADLKEHRSRRLGAKLDLKGVGGYVAAPPSLHPDGHRYEWITPMLQADGTIQPPLELPAELAAFLDDLAAVEIENTYPERELSPVLTLVDGVLRIGHEASSIMGLVSYVASLREGNRNAGLFWAAATAHEDGFSQHEAITALVPAAVSVGLDEREATVAVKSGYRRKRA